MLALGDQIVGRLELFVIGHDDDTPFVFIVLAELDAALILRDDGVILGLAGFEQFRDPGQTAGDIASLGGFARDPREHVAGINLLAVFDAQDGVHRHEIACLQPVRQLDHPAAAVAQGDARPQIGGPRLLLPVNHHLGRDAGRIVHRFAHGHAVVQIDVIGGPLFFSDDRQCIGIPFRQLVAAADFLAVLNQKFGAVGNAVTGAFALTFIDQQKLGIAAHDDIDAGRVFDDVAVDQFDLCIGR